MQKNNSFSQAYGLFICAIAGIFYAYEFLLRILPGAIQTELMTAFGNISAASFGQLAALYYFAYSPMQLPVGILMDRFGPRKILVFSCLICAIGSWLFAQTDYIWLAGIGRFLVGFGSAFAFVGMLFLGHNWLPTKYFSLLAGLVTTFAMLFVVFGVVKITELTASIGLKTTLLLLVWCGLILTIVMVVFVKDAPDGKKHTHSLSWMQFFKEVWCVLTEPSVWIIGLIGGSMYTSLSVFGELWGKVYLEQAHHLTSLEAAKAISAVFLGWAVGAPSLGYLSDHSGHRFLLLFLGAALGAIFISIVIYMPGLSFKTVFGLLFLYGVTTSTEIIVFVMGKEWSNTKLAGTVFASVNMLVMLFGMVLQPLVGYILDYSAGSNALINGHRIFSVKDYQLALSFLPLTLILAIVLLVIFKFSMQHRKQPT